MKTLIIDNFDSFTYNLYQLCHELEGNPEVYRNNQIKIEDIEKGNYTHIILSPGPGEPSKRRDFGICTEIIRRFSGVLPILGVCLGHQGIIYHYGGKIVRAPIPVHGKQSFIKIKNTHPLFQGLPEEIEVMRYHSLVGDKKTLSPQLEIIGETIDDGLIMAIAHQHFPLYGVQFHPESIGTAVGKKILNNFLEIKFKPYRKKIPFSSYSTSEMKGIFEAMINGRYQEKEIEQILQTLAQRGETVAEILGAVLSMRDYAVALNLPKNDCMDICGTGGSGLPRMNISTTAAFVLAACGIKIAKHGNKAASGRCGSSDLLEGVGININLSPEQISRGIEELGIGFLHAPLFHPALKIFMPIRKRIGTRTIFNLLGPILNPANPRYQLLGTTDQNSAFKIAHVLSRTACKRAMVVTAGNGLDEVTNKGETYCFEVQEGAVRAFVFRPEDIGISSLSDFSEISSNGIAQNIENFHLLLRGKATAALQNLLLLNCAFALYIRGVSSDIQSGFALGQDIIRSGGAYQKFLDYKHFSTL